MNGVCYSTQTLILSFPHISFCHSPMSPVFRPGENGMYWYVVVSGTLDMLHVDPRNDQKVELQ